MSAPPGLRRWARGGLLLFLGFVAYGSLFPFHFSREPSRDAAGNLRVMWSPLDARGKRQVERLDVAANVLLGIPEGAGLVLAGWAGRAALPRLLAAGAGSAAFGTAVETAQLYAPRRKASAVDVVAQVAGALIGALATHVALRALATTPWLRRAWPAARAGSAGPAALGIALVIALCLAADAWYPFAISLDVSTGWESLKRAQLLPLRSLATRFWADLLVERVGAYAALAAALWAALRGAGRSGGPPRVALWTAVAAWAAALEVAKVLVPGRAPNVDNALLGAAGAAAALLVAPWVAASTSVRRHGRALLVVAALALVAYEELTPFDWALDAPSIRRKLDRLEWLPGASYYLAELRPVLFDAGKKLVLGAALGAALAAWRGRGAAIPGVTATAAIALGWGAAMETLQILQRSHVPAVTDALLLALGAVLGHMMWEQIGVSDAGH